MAEMLNLDDLVKEEKVLKFKGKEHPMSEMSVQDYIEIVRLSETIEEDMSIADQMEVMIKMIKMSFPTLTEEDMRGLNIQQLNAITDFAQEDMPGEGAEGN